MNINTLSVLGCMFMFAATVVAVLAAFAISQGRLPPLMCQFTALTDTGWCVPGAPVFLDC